MSDVIQDNSVLFRLLKAVAGELEADAFFSNVPVITEDLGDVENGVQRALADAGVAGETAGAALLLILQTADCSNGDQPGPYFDKIGIVGRAIENGPINRTISGTGKSARSIAEHFLKVCHQNRNLPFMLLADKEAITHGPDARESIYDARVYTKAGIESDIPKLAAIVAQCTGMDLTLSCATPGAAIFYTLDGVTRPSTRLGTLYTEAIHLQSGEKLRARAWLSGFIPSDEYRLTVA